MFGYGKTAAKNTYRWNRAYSLSLLSGKTNGREESFIMKKILKRALKELRDGLKNLNADLDTLCSCVHPLAKHFIAKPHKCALCVCKGFERGKT